MLFGAADVDDQIVFSLFQPVTCLDVFLVNKLGIYDMMQDFCLLKNSHIHRVNQTHKQTHFLRIVVVFCFILNDSGARRRVREQEAGSPPGIQAKPPPPHFIAMPQ